MGSAEFSRWLVFFEREPIGPHGELQRWAALMAATANGPLQKKDKTPFKVGEFLPDAWAEPAAKPEARNPKPAELRAFVAGIKPGKKRSR